MCGAPVREHTFLPLHLRLSELTSSGSQWPVINLVALRQGLPNWQK